MNNLPPRAARLAAVVLLILPCKVHACLWDYDTLMMERSRFPNTLELITGKFLRHSKEFYEWRIRDRVAKLKSEPENLGYYDDLAVAYDKVGDHEKAIATILAKDAKKPGLYETEANLGTFYIHSGQLEKGLGHIKRAIQINPNAHFGREKYQQLLVEYLLTQRQAGNTTLPVAKVKPVRKRLPDGKEAWAGEDFASFLWPPPKKFPGEKARQGAVTGILGMMKFGQHDSPILLEALGTLLSRMGTNQVVDDEGDDAKRLAARAFLKASYGVPEASAQAAYREMAKEVLTYQTIHPYTYDTLSVERLERAFQEELAEAQGWYASVRENELAWIRDGKDADLEFTRAYYEEPRVLSNSEDVQPSFYERHKGPVRGFVLAGLPCAAILGLLAWRTSAHLRQRNRANVRG